jgi:hypothetical protein
MKRPPVPYQLVLRIVTLGIVFSIPFLTGCSKSQQVLVEAPPAYQPSPPAPLPDVPKLPAKENEVQDAVKRVFKDAAVLDTSYEPNFIAGDFNGDNSQDIAVVIKPVAGKLAEMNEEYPAWIVKDPFAPVLSKTSPRIEANDVLLGVIHGYGANDWRDPQATQTYLLKNAVGSRLTVQKKKEALAANAGKKVPRLQGDVIGENLRGTTGYLYFTGPTYAWYDPNTFKGEPELRLVHPGIMPKAAR